MRKPVVVHCKRDQFDVYIGRGSKWGNPYRIGTHGTRAEVIAQYRAYLERSPHLLEALDELEGQRLGCFCAPKPCHGHVLAEFTQRRDAR